MRAFGDRGSDYELVRSGKPLAAKAAWRDTYELRAIPGVVYAEPRFSVSISDNPAWRSASTGSAQDSGGDDPPLPESSPPEWSLEAVRAKEAWQHFFPQPGAPPGHGVRVGHPDTGYQDHPEIIDAILGADGYDFLHEDRDAHDDLEKPFGVPVPNPGHGTGTSSVIVSPTGAQRTYPSNGWVSGIAPGAKVIPLRAAYSVVLLSTLNLSRAIEYAAAHSAHVISISMGGLAAWRLRRAVAFAQSRGVIICAAAGNYSPFVVWPAAYDEVIACAASNARGGVWRWGSHGAAVDVTAPGESVWRASVERAKNGLKYDVGRGSGTSFAVTATAGVAALWLSHHGRDKLLTQYGAEKLPFVFNRILRESCVRFPGWQSGEYGSGLVDAVRTLAAPLPDLATDSIGAPGPQLEGHPALDRGEVTTFVHLFEQFAPGSEDGSDAAPAYVTRTLSALLSVSPHALPNRLREVGQELAFHLATDPVSYRAFAEALGSASKQPPSDAPPSADAEIVALRRRIAADASPHLQHRLAHGN